MYIYLVKFRFILSESHSNFNSTLTKLNFRHEITPNRMYEYTEKITFFLILDIVRATLYTELSRQQNKVLVLNFFKIFKPGLNNFTLMLYHHVLIILQV